MNSQGHQAIAAKLGDWIAASKLTADWWGAQQVSDWLDERCEDPEPILAAIERIGDKTVRVLCVKVRRYRAAQARPKIGNGPAAPKPKAKQKANPSAGSAAKPIERETTGAPFWEDIGFAASDPKADARQVFVEWVCARDRKPFVVEFEACARRRVYTFKKAYRARTRHASLSRIPREPAAPKAVALPSRSLAKRVGDYLRLRPDEKPASAPPPWKFSIPELREKYCCPWCGIRFFRLSDGRALVYVYCDKCGDYYCGSSIEGHDGSDYSNAFFCCPACRDRDPVERLAPPSGLRVFADANLDPKKPGTSVRVREKGGGRSGLPAIRGRHVEKRSQ